MGNYRNDLRYGGLLERWEEPDPLAYNSEYVHMKATSLNEENLPNMLGIGTMTG